MQRREPLITAATKKVFETGSRQPVRNPYFSELNDELADRGFLVTSADNLITWARTGSLMWMFGTSPALTCFHHN
jgi:NADH-quinone oxidoreductase subunit B